MSRPAPATWVFFREFYRQFHTTGSLTPSSRVLSRALARFVRQEVGGEPRRILEIGPGTGPVTKEIVAALGPNDRLDLIEINEHFVEVLEHRFKNEPDFQAVSERTRILCRPIEEVARDESYDVLVSGLPLNNFSVAEVEHILGIFEELARPGARLSFFEYIAIRSIKGVVSRRGERERLQGIGRAMDQFLERETNRDGVWRNIPPAWVHHVQFTNRSQETHEEVAAQV